MGSIIEQKKVAKNGKVSTRYRVHVRRKGFASKSKVCDSLKEAKEWLRNNEADATLKRPSQGRTFEKLLDDFVALGDCAYAAMPHLDFWREQFGTCKVAEISHGDIAGAVLVLRQRPAMRSTPMGSLETERKLAASTINRYLATLSAVFSFALFHEVIDVHPMKGGRVKKMKEGNGRTRILTEDEEDRLLLAAKHSEWPMMWLFLRMLLTTGARRSEVNTMRWADVNLAESIAILSTTKNGHARALPLVSDVKAALADAAKVKPLKGDYVFYDPKHPEKPKPVETVWKACRKAAGLEDSDVVLHTTRHSAITKLVKGGANLAQVAVVSGHRTLAMLSRYEHLAAQDAVDLAERLLSGNHRKTDAGR